ncbi:hypothetical protein ACFWA6_20300 [Streptomyces sp. NPDC060020]|uniref:hypothetical protein n=1 Tax=Streptomyces sp. NPDC060020 TaxID=3347038 RepID=UPI00368B8746
MATAEKNNGGGRPWGPIRGENQQAHDLAVFLRARVDESKKTLAMLSLDMEVSKAQISVYLGGKIPSQAFVTKIINATVPAPLRARRHSQANTLLQDAKHPRPGPRPRSASVGFVELERAQALQLETYRRLTHSLEQQVELRQSVDTYAKLVMVLLGMVHQLQDKVTGLTNERDHLAHADHTGVLKTTQRQLTRAQAQKEQAREELERAEEKRRLAEELAGRLQQKIEQLTDYLDRLRGDGPSPHDHLPGLAPVVPGSVSEDPEGDDIDHVLARVSAVNDSEGDTIDRISTELTRPDNGLSVPDNPLTSTNVPDGEATRQSVPEPDDASLGTFANAALLGSVYLFLRWTKTARSEGAGKAATARDLYTDLIADRTRSLGPDHLDTLSARHEHAYWAGEAGDPAAARDLFMKLATDRTRILGPDHLDTLTTRKAVENWTDRTRNAGP